MVPNMGRRNKKKRKQGLKSQLVVKNSEGDSLL